MTIMKMRLMVQKGGGDDGSGREKPEIVGLLEEEWGSRLRHGGAGEPGEGTSRGLLDRGEGTRPGGSGPRDCSPEQPPSRSSATPSWGSSCSRPRTCSSGPGSPAPRGSRCPTPPPPPGSTGRPSRQLRFVEMMKSIHILGKEKKNIWEKKLTKRKCRKKERSWGEKQPSKMSNSNIVESF